MNNLLLSCMAFALGAVNTENKPETPQFLYKVVSYQNWRATERRKAVILSADDDAFIHFSTAKELAKIVKKFWADAPEFVVLKVNVSQLKGRLKYEANSAGSNQSYRLYDGFIPTQAIVEAKITFKKPIALFSHNKLDVVQSGDPVLRKKARLLTKKEILSDEIQSLIEEMKEAMRAAPGVGLAAPQIGRAIQLAVIEDMEHSHLTPQQLVERDRRKVPFHVVINPTLIVEESETASFFEGCLSIPSILGVTPRATAVRVECLNENGEPVVIRAKGWHARILQHEIDHLNGILFIDKAVKETLMTDENYLKFWNGKPIREICDCLTHR